MLALRQHVCAAVPDCPPPHNQKKGVHCPFFFSFSQKKRDPPRTFASAAAPMVQQQYTNMYVARQPNKGLH
jgi:hypothetical protein